MRKSKNKNVNIAYNRWKNLSEDIRRKVLETVFCVKCGGATEIVDYKEEVSKGLLVLRGKCKRCGHEVARVLEGD
jgi:hypothetical protein